MNETQITDVNPNADKISSLEAQIAQIDVTTLDPNDNGKILQDSPVVEQKQQTQVETKVEEVKSTTETTEDPIKAELERVKGQTQGKTPQEKFEYKLKVQLAQAKEMGIDVSKFGIKSETDESVDEDKPLTRKDLESILSSVKPKTKSATEMALNIENEAERELHLYYLENKVNPNLTEEEKFQTAREMVDGIKLKNQMNLNNIRPDVQRNSTANSVQPLKDTNFDNQKLTPEENIFFTDAQKRGIPFTKEEIILMRGK